ncbi:MAG: gamma-glutamylcyclotransferase [Leptolyngbyaceae cyanobacterium bins.59]|nr:gamma-glutamylcyclotransferase [Leptolyngbyaceae cyanobacterium bins.59]
MPETIDLAVNGTLMRGLALNQNLQMIGAAFLREDFTEPAYRLWSIGDNYPAMIRVREGGTQIAVEVWQVPTSGLVQLLLREPPGLAIGRVTLQDGSSVFGVLGEPFICENQPEITKWGGWRSYIEAIKVGG